MLTKYVLINKAVLKFAKEHECSACNTTNNVLVHQKCCLIYNYCEVFLLTTKMFAFSVIPWGQILHFLQICFLACSLFFFTAVFVVFVFVAAPFFCMLPQLSSRKTAWNEWWMNGSHGTFTQISHLTKVLHLDTTKWCSISVNIEWKNKSQCVVLLFFCPSP